MVGLQSGQSAKRSFSEAVVQRSGQTASAVKKIIIMRILIINGPNLNMLGQREPDIYGSETMEDVMNNLRRQFPDVSLDYYQSNHEGCLIDRLQECAFLSF